MSTTDSILYLVDRLATMEPQLAALKTSEESAWTAAKNLREDVDYWRNRCLSSEKDFRAEKDRADFAEGSVAHLKTLLDDEDFSPIPDNGDGGYVA